MRQPVNIAKSVRFFVPALALLLGSLPRPALALTENFTPGMADYVFFTFVVSAILFSTAMLIAMGTYRWLVYVGFAAFMVVYTAASGGVISYMIGATDFNLFVVPYLIYGGLTAYGFWMAGWLLEAGHSLARFRPWLYALGVAAAVGPLTSYFWLMKIPLNLMWLPQHVLYIVMILSQMLPPLTWQALGKTERRLVLAFPVVIALFILISAGVAGALLDVSQDTLNALSRTNVALFLSFSLALMLWHGFATTKAKQEVERRALETAKREAELKLALVESEQQYERARTVAAQQRSQLEKVSHDLKQPISALRMAVGGMTDEGEQTGTLTRAIDYVDQLAQSFVAPGEAEAHDDAEALGSGAGGREAVSTLLFAESLEQMFADEAAHAGIDLRFRCQRATVSVIPLATMRVFANVLANALAHANAGKILVTFRRRLDGVLFAVYDNGDGMDAETCARVLNKGEKGPRSNGEGLGLSIVQDLCESQGFGFQIRSRPGHGTVVTVALA